MVEKNKVDDNLMAITPLINSNTIEVETILGGSVRYSCNYLMKKKDLPKINAVFLDPPHKWKDDPIFSLEFKMGQDFTLIYSHLKLLKADYEHRNIQGSIDVIRITSKSIPVIAYLSNLYKDISYEASYLLRESLFPMMNWAIDKYEPTLAQDFGIWAAHWADPEEELIIPIKEDTHCLTHMTCEYKNVTLYMEEQNKIAIENSYKDQYKRMSLEEKMDKYEVLVSNLVYTRVEEIIEDMQVNKVQKKLKQMEYEQACFMFNNTEQCNSFLYSKYPEIKLKSELLSTNINNELMSLDSLKVNVEKFTKNTKDTTSIIGTVIFDIIVRAVEGAGGQEAVVKGLEMVGGAVATVAIIPYALPVLGTALAVSKLTASVFSLAVRNDWVDFSSKESDHKRSREDVVKEFSCKVTICSINKFSQLTEDGQKKLAIFFSKYIYYSIKNKDDTYKTVDSFLSNLSNSTYLNTLKIAKDLSSNLSMIDGNDMTIGNYFSDYNQAACYEDIKISLAGDVSVNQES